MNLKRVPLGLPLVAFVLSVHGAAGWMLSAAFEARPGGSPSRGLVTVFVLGSAEAVARPPLSADEPPGAGDSARHPAALPVEFHRSSEVDEAAHPVAGWSLDGEDLAALGVQRIEFEAWVDEQARIAAIQVRVVEPSSLASLAPLIEARLRQTPMVAARKAGKPVPHRQTIELGLTRPVEPDR